MQEVHTAGVKQFAITLLVSALLYILCGVMMSAFSDYAFIGGIISVLVFCVFGFFVLTHYTARFSYTLKNGRLRINRMIGKRNREIEFACADITRIVNGYKPLDFPKHIYSMKTAIISSKDCMYIEYNDKSGGLSAVVINPSQKLRKRIEREKDND